MNEVVVHKLTNNHDYSSIQYNNSFLKHKTCCKIFDAKLRELYVPLDKHLTTFWKYLYAVQTVKKYND